MSDEIEEIPEPEPLPTTPCASCGGDELILVGWDDEDGSDILGPCPTCS